MIAEEEDKEEPIERRGNQHKTEGELERWESVIRTNGTMEAIRKIQRRNELDKAGTLIKDNLK